MSLNTNQVQIVYVVFETCKTLHQIFGDIILKRRNISPIVAKSNNQNKNSNNCDTWRSKSLPTAECVLFFCPGCVQQNTGCVQPCVLVFFPTRGKFSVVYRLCTAFVPKEHTSCTHPVDCVLCLDVYCTTLKTHSIHIGPIQWESCKIGFFSWILLLELASCFKTKLWENEMVPGNGTRVPLGTSVKLYR